MNLPAFGCACYGPDKKIADFLWWYRRSRRFRRRSQGIHAEVVFSFSCFSGDARRVNGLVEGKGMVVMTVPFWYDVASLSVECTAVVCIGCIIIGKIPLFGGRFGRENGKLLHKRVRNVCNIWFYILHLFLQTQVGRAVCFFIYL